MKRQLALLLTLLMCVGIGCPAGALEINGARGAGGTVRRGYYYNGNVSFKLPGAAWTESSAVAYDDHDEILLSGTADVNGFIPSMYIQINSETWDIDAGFEDIGIANSIRVANQTFTVNDEIRAHYDCYLENDTDGRMGLDYLIWFNCGDYGVAIYYYTFAATRSIPDDLPALDDVVASFTIGQ